MVQKHILPSFIALLSAVTMLTGHVYGQQLVDQQASLRPKAPGEIDSLYIGTFARRNEARVFYGSQSIGLNYGSRHESDATAPVEHNNANSFIGIGLTYKILDGDLSFSLPKTRIVNQDLQNLSQVQFGLSYTGRKWVFRGFISNCEGVVAGNPENEYESSPDVNLNKLGVQATYVFNSRKYSYRAAVLQNEIQRKSAGSFFLKAEAFYRKLGTGSRLVPAAMDVPQVYGDQVGLRYLNAPGLLVMPGYGYTFTRGRNFYLAPRIFAGPGIAFNFYEGDVGKLTYTNWELAGMAALTAGYNHSRFYINVLASEEASYIPLNPTYFLSTTFRVAITVGYRFSNFEKVVPGSL